MAITQLTVDDFRKTLTVADRGETSALLSSLGYVRESVSPELLMKAYKEHGDKFAVPYGRIGQASMNTRINNSFMDGDGGNALAYINSIFGFLISGAEATPGIINSANGTDSMLAQAQLTIAQSQQQYQAQRSSYITLGIIAAVVVVLVVVLIVALRKK